MWLNVSGGLVLVKYVIILLLQLSARANSGAGWAANTEHCVLPHCPRLASTHTVTITGN